MPYWLFFKIYAFPPVNWSIVKLVNWSIVNLFGTSVVLGISAHFVENVLTPVLLYIVDIFVEGDKHYASTLTAATARGSSLERFCPAFFPRQGSSVKKNNVLDARSLPFSFT